MPFDKIGKDKYRGPSGKTFNYAQVKLYYSRGGSFPGESHKKKTEKKHRTLSSLGGFK